MNFRNSITQLLDISYPIISAPMANVSGALLASEVTNAGGLGMIGGGYCDKDWIANELLKIKPKMFGIGFITWRLQQHPEVLAMAIKHQPRAIMLSFGDITPFVSTIKEARIPLICQIQTLEQAKQVKEQGADIIIAQGSEAGGHGASRGTLALIPAVVDVAGDTPVVAAGGIADGRGFVASLVLGAKGALIGTRFYASNEALGSDPLKQKLVQASGDETLRTNLFDFLRGFDWPEPYTARVLENNFTRKWHNKSMRVENMNNDIRNKYKKAVIDDDFKLAAIFSGEDLDLIHEILPAKSIIKNIIAESEAIMNNICSVD